MKKYLLLTGILASFISCKKTVIKENTENLQSYNTINVDSAKLIHNIKIRKIDIAEIVFGDCIYSYLKNDCKEEALSYPKNIVEKNRDFIFSTVFFEKIQQNEFSLFSEHIDGQKCLCINISKNTESSEFSVIYWFQKINDRFYFIGMTCVG